MFHEKKGMKARGGQVFIIVLVIFVIVFLMFALFALVPAREARRRATPLVRSVFWKIADRNVSEAYVNEEIELHVVLEATEEYEGSIVVKIKKDISYWFDSDYAVKTFPVSLIGSQATELSLLFAPDQPSGSTLRGYFIQIDFPAKQTDWTMDNSYPPRLIINERPIIPNIPASMTWQ